MRTGILQTLLSMSVTVAACSCVERPPLDAVKKAPDWENMSPLEMLREAGRICCDARTLEAVGRIEIPTDLEGAESGSIRWVFGPDGEYRFEQGSVLVVFDTEYIAMKRDGTWQDNVIHARSMQSNPQAPHNRYWGDMVMAAGMAARTGMTYPMAITRLLGPAWTDHLFTSDALLEFGEDDLVAGHACKTIVVIEPTEDRTLTLWLDSDLGLIRKWEMGAAGNYTAWAVYEELRLNPRLAPGEFAIPKEVKRAAQRPPERIRVSPPQSPKGADSGDDL